MSMKFELFSAGQAVTANVKAKPKMAAILDASDTYPKFVNRRTTDMVHPVSDGTEFIYRKLEMLDVELAVQGVSEEIALDIERMVQEREPIYLNSNVGEDTIFSCPLTRGVGTIVGGDATFTRASKGYSWDDIGKTIETWDANEPRTARGGPYEGYFVGGPPSNNLANTPKPTSSGTGWSTIGGSPTISYSEEVLTNLRDYIEVTNQKGRTKIIMPYSSAIAHSASGLSTGDGIWGAFVAKGYGTYVVALRDSAGTTVDQKNVTLTGDDQFIWLAGKNLSGGTTGDILIICSSINGAIIYIDTVCIQSGKLLLNEHAAGKLWASASDSQDLLTFTPIVPNGPRTFSFMMRMTHAPFIAYRLNTATTTWIRKNSEDYVGIGDAMYFRGGSTADAIWTDIFAETGLSEGDWVHVVILCSETSARLFLNGVEHSGGSKTMKIPTDAPTIMHVGCYSSSYYGVPDDGGLALFRIDDGAQDEAFALRLYDTYGSTYGKAFSKRTLGRIYRIETNDLTPDPNRSDSTLWTGTLVLRQIGIDDTICPIMARAS